jgi:hypothetical protein
MAGGQSTGTTAPRDAESKVRRAGECILCVREDREMVDLPAVQAKCHASKEREMRSEGVIDKQDCTSSEEKEEEAVERVLRDGKSNQAATTKKGTRTRAHQLMKGRARTPGKGCQVSLCFREKGKVSNVATHWFRLLLAIALSTFLKVSSITAHSSPQPSTGNECVTDQFSAHVAE